MMPRITSVVRALDGEGFRRNRGGEGELVFPSARLVASFRKAVKARRLHAGRALLAPHAVPRSSSRSSLRPRVPRPAFLHGSGDRQRHAPRRNNAETVRRARGSSQRSEVGARVPIACDLSGDHRT